MGFRYFAQGRVRLPDETAKDYSVRRKQVIASRALLSKDELERTVSKMDLQGCFDGLWIGIPLPPDGYKEIVHAFGGFAAHVEGHKRMQYDKLKVRSDGVVIH